MKALIFAALRMLLIASALLLPFRNLQAQNNSISVDWENTVVVAKTTPTLQLVENPMVRNSSPIHASTFKALKEL